MAKKAVTKKKSSTPKKLTLAPTVVLDRDEMAKIGDILQDMQDVKDAHKAVQNARRLKEAEIDVLSAKIEIEKSAVSDINDRSARLENRFNELNRSKNVLVTEICEKHGIITQELEYDPTTGVVLNIKK